MWLCITSIITTHYNYSKNWNTVKGWSCMAATCVTLNWLSQNKFLKDRWFTMSVLCVWSYPPSLLLFHIPYLCLSGVHVWKEGYNYRAHWLAQTLADNLSLIRKNHVSNVLFQLFPFCENLSLLFQKKCGSVIKGVKRSFIFSNLLFIIHLSLLSLLLCYLFSITEGKDGKRFCVVFVVVST